MEEKVITYKRIKLFNFFNEFFVYNAKKFSQRLRRNLNLKIQKANEMMIVKQKLQKSRKA